MSSNTALYYHPEGFTTTASRLMGRHAAGEGFLRGWARHADVDRLVCFADKIGFAQHFTNAVADFGWKGPVGWIDTSNPRKLEETGSLFLPGPGLAAHAWTRRGVGHQHGYSIVGVTHTTASTSALDNIGALLTGPVQEWDALICTSSAVRSMVVDLLATQADYLGHRFGIDKSHRFTLPQLPVIPLGVEADAFAEDAQKRSEWRERLGLGATDVAVLFVGRLSFHAKAHPVPMYMALQAATDALPAGSRLHLIEAGWFANDKVRDAFADAAAVHCPDVIRHVLDGREPDVRREIWQAADIFCSLSDNIQETFGLTPVEAMAAGLPCVVSDWDGYKETVRHGVDGFRVPTWLPPTPLGVDLAHRHAMDIDSYDYYCGKACQFVAVDPFMAGSLFRLLVGDPDLRRRMGAAGRERARTLFDWRAIVGRYQALFGELQQRRSAVTAESVPVGRGLPYWPLRPDPFRSFAGYPTHGLQPDSLAVPVEGVDRARLAALYASPMVKYASEALPPTELMQALLDGLAAQGPCKVDQLLNDIQSVPDRYHAMRGLVFLAKYGLVALAAPSTGEARS